MHTYVLSLDFECPGGVPMYHSFTQLGAVIMEAETYRVVSSFSKYNNMIGYTWDPKTIEEFWSKEENAEFYSKTLEGTTHSPYYEIEVIEHFWEWVTKTMNEHNISPDSIYIISDNVAFDIGVLKTFSRINPLTFFGKYRDIIDTSSVYAGMSRKRVTASSIDNESSLALALEALREHTGNKSLVYPDFPKANHDPVVDATNIANHWLFIQNTLK